MPTNRVIVANEPRLLRGMLRRVISRVPDLEAVEIAHPIQLLPAVYKSQAQWVILSLWPEGDLPSAVRSMMVKHAPPYIMGIADDGSQARIVRNGSTEESCLDLTLDDLITILQREVTYYGHC